MRVCVCVRERERERVSEREREGRMTVEGQRERAGQNHLRWTSRAKVSKPPAVSPLEGSSS